jgi:hypothetical protein
MHLHYKIEVTRMGRDKVTKEGRIGRGGWS